MRTTPVQFRPSAARPDQPAFTAALRAPSGAPIVRRRRSQPRDLGGSRWANPKSTPTSGVGGSCGAVLQPARDRARQLDPQRRHPDDRPRAPRHQQPAAVDGRFVHLGVRRAAAHRRQPRRPLRPRAAPCRSGFVVFGLGSLLSALATSANQLIATRAFMGVGGAFIMPATLSIITNVFPADERGRAIGVWAGVAGVGAALGPLTGGFLVEHFYWGSIFLVNLPIVLSALLAGFFLIPTPRIPTPTKLDPVGAVLSIVGSGVAAVRHHRGPQRGLERSDDRRRLRHRRRAARGRSSSGRSAARPPHARRSLLPNPRFSAASGAITLIVLRHVRFALRAHAVPAVRAAATRRSRRASGCCPSPSR